MPLAPPSRGLASVAVTVAAALTVAAMTVAVLTLAALTVAALAEAAPATAATGPNVTLGSAYLTAPANLIHGHFYESFPGYADFGLTIDGAFALAATGDQNPALKGIVTFLDSAGKDPHKNTINTWTGIGTKLAAGGDIGDEALLAEVTGYNPRDFGGHNLISALNASVCARASHGGNARCAAAGNYSYASSVFDQSLGIIAQIRAGQVSEAAAAVRYLESLRNSDGSFPSLIPDSHDHDVDSTAMAVMALALVPGPTAAADVKAGQAWLASRQESTGGFPGTSGDSVNSTGLAIQALALAGTKFQTPISNALAFLAREQNGNGGFNVAAGQRGSNVRASAEALGGVVGTSFGTLHRNLSGTHVPPPPPPGRRRHPSPKPKPAPRPASTVTQTVAAAPSASGTPSRTAAAAPGSSPGQPGTSHPAIARTTKLANAGDDSSLSTDLWWSVLGVAVAAAVVIGALFRRRRRLYPAASTPAAKPGKSARGHA